MIIDDIALVWPAAARPRCKCPGCSSACSAAAAPADDGDGEPLGAYECACNAGYVQMDGGKHGCGYPYPIGYRGEHWVVVVGW